MSEQKHRLMQAIQEKGFKSPTDAWRANQRALGISQDLMISNTNGNRPISKGAAEKYARVFGYTPGWYLFGNESERETTKATKSSTQATNLAPQLAEVFADLLKASPQVQNRALKLLRSTVYGQGSTKSREIRTKQSS